MIDDRPPWLGSHGQVLSTEELREISKDWPTEIWNQYAENLESPQTEFMTRHYQTILDNFANTPEESLSDVQEDESPDYSALKTAFASLPTLDQAILEANLLEFISEKNIARKFGITRRDVMSSKKRSISFLKTRMAAHASSEIFRSFRNSKEIDPENRDIKKIHTS